MGYFAIDLCGTNALEIFNELSTCFNYLQFFASRYTARHRIKKNKKTKKSKSIYFTMGSLGKKETVCANLAACFVYLFWINFFSYNVCNDNKIFKSAFFNAKN